MAERRPLPLAAKIHAGGTFLAAVGVASEYAVGVPGFPTIPPGPIILAVCGILVVTLMARLKWMIIVGLAGPVFITIGGALEGSGWDRLADPAHVAFFIATALQWAGLAVSLVFGIAALLQVLRTAPSRAAA